MVYSRHMAYQLLDIIFPYRCLACRTYCEREYLCRKCFKKIPIKKQSECVGCKRATPDGKTCAFCKEDNPLDRLLIVSDFKQPTVAKAIKKMKYGFIEDLLDPLHELTRSYLKLRAKKGQSFLAENPLLVPVPLHYRRENWRGFNQARVLAERLGRAYQMAWAEPIVRTGYRDPQADIEGRNQRIENARGLYACVQPVLAQDRHIILIDDVCTTGATLNECARVLKAAGAKHVSALVLARG